MMLCGVKAEGSFLFVSVQLATHTLMQEFEGERNLNGMHWWLIEIIMLLRNITIKNAL